LMMMLKRLKWVDDNQLVISGGIGSWDSSHSCILC